MLNFKWISIAALAVVSNVTFADPGHTPSWSFGASALYLQPSFGGNGLSYSAFNNYSGRDINGTFVGNNGEPNHISNVHPRWGWGYQIEGGYRFSSKTDVNVNWYHLDEMTHGSFPVGSLFSGSADGFYATSLQLSSRWDAVNIEMGQHVLFCDNKMLRLHGGIEYANIKNRFTNHPQSQPTSLPVFVTVDTMTYQGIGPRFGGDFEYAVARNVELYAKAAGSLLVGETKQSISGYENYSNNVYGLMLYGTPNYHFSKNGVVVPEVEAKLGVKYDYTMTQSSVSFDLGYMWITYLNSINAYTGIGIVGSSVGTTSNANYDLNGAYFNAKWSGNI